MFSLKTFAAAVTIAAVVASTTATSMAYGADSFSLSTPGSVNQGSTFSVVIRETGTDVTNVTAKLTFDASKVQFNGIDASGSAFDGIASNETNGQSRFVSGGGTVSGTNTVATANFTALTTGTASISMAGGSLISMKNSQNSSTAGVDWNGDVATVNVSVVTPAPAAAPAPVASTPRATTSTGSSTSTTPVVTETPAAPAPVATPAAPKASVKKDAAKQTANYANVQNVADTNVSPLTWVLVAALILVSAGYLLRERFTAASSAVYRKYKK